MYEIILRKKLEEEFYKTNKYSLTVAIAPMGYGKTVGAINYINKKNVNYIYLSLEAEQKESQSIWDTFCRQLERTNKEFSKKIDDLGFPNDIKKYNYFLKILSSYVSDSKIILIIDDYHFCLSDEVNRFFYMLSKSKIDNLHILLLTRILPDIKIEELKLKDICYLIKPETFILTKQEVARYYRQCKIKATKEVIDKTYLLSEGWISAVRLIAEKYNLTSNMDNILSLDSLIKDTIISKYNDREIELLGKLSIFDSFKLEQVIRVTGLKKDEILSVIKNNTFIRYDEKNEDYKVHNIFSKYLQKYHTVDKNNKKELYIINGKWLVENNQPLEGIKNFLLVKEYKLVLKEFAKNESAELFNKHRSFMYNTYKMIPEELVLENPYACLNIASFLITIINPEEGSILLFKLLNHIEQTDKLNTEKRKILGDIYHLKAIMQYNDIEKMASDIKIAYDLLDGKSKICTIKKLASLGSTSVLFSYYTKAGMLKEHIEFMCENFKYYIKISGGCGKGMNELARAEYALETLDIKNATIYANRAILKAREGNQLDVILLATNVLAKAKVYYNETKTALDLLLYIPELEQLLLNPTCLSQYDICLSNIYFNMNKFDMMTNWIKKGEFEKSNILPLSHGLNYIIYGKALVLSKDYIKLEYICEKMLELLKARNNLLGIVHTYILFAIAKFHLYGVKSCLESLNKAIEICSKDNIYMTFIEYDTHILPILKESDFKDEYTIKLVKILEDKSALTQTSHLDLSSREYQILELLKEGKTNKEISENLYIAEITVKKILSRIYKKHKVKNRKEFFEKY